MIMRKPEFIPPTDEEFTAAVTRLLLARDEAVVDDVAVVLAHIGRLLGIDIDELFRLDDEGLLLRPFISPSPRAAFPSARGLIHH